MRPHTGGAVAEGSDHTGPVPGGPTLRSHRPAPALRAWLGPTSGYVTEAEPAGLHHGVPSAHLTFLLCLDGALDLLTEPGGRSERFVAMVAGLHLRPAFIRQDRRQAGLQLRLTWRGARALLGVPAAALAGRNVELDALLGRRTGPLLDRLAAAPGWPARFALLDAELAALADRGRGERGVLPEVGYAWDRLESCGGRLRIEQLAREVGWSRRHLAARFSAETGLAPKAAARLIRFERACERLRGPGRPALAQVAADGGYVDQSHLSRDFRELAGQSAGAWLAERTAGRAAGC